MEHESSNSDIDQETVLKDWIGNSQERNPRVVDGKGDKGLLNEPNGCWAKTDSETGELLGLYIADTGNNCLRFSDLEGSLKTLELFKIPDVKETASDCTGGKCEANFDLSESESEDK